MRRKTKMGTRATTIALAFALGIGTLGFCVGCGADSDAGTSQDAAEQEQVDDELADGVYEIEVETDSSMFRAESCTLTAKDGEYVATLTLPGQGFTRLYFGSAEDAVEADLSSIYDYTLNDEGLYTFELPVEELDEELEIAAYGHRRDTWYDHTIIFHAPTGAPIAEAE